jgi:putative DNA primase/helicase
VSLCKTNRVAIDRSANVGIEPAIAAAKIHQWGDEGPPKWTDEVRRHSYSDSAGQIVKVKIKKQDGSYTNWYRVSGGWQAQKPVSYIDVPYTTRGIYPFDPELKDDGIHWPEGEKDVDTFNGLNLPAFAFGGVGDGLTADVQSRLKDYVQGRHIVIHADNDEAGRKHAQEKAARAHAAGAVSIKIVEFPKLPPKGDVTDFIAAGGTAEDLNRCADAAPVWKPNLPEVSADPIRSNDDTAGSELIMRRMSDVQPERIEWLWQGRIAIGKQTLIGGEPGLGKSQITAALAAAVTTGGQWPCNEGRAPKGSVLILSAEDDAADTIRPRLDAAGADASGVHLISAVSDIDGNGRRTFNLQADLSLLEKAIKRIADVRLVIIDPVSSYLGRIDSHKNADVRGTLEPLGDMASRLRVAVVSITHFSKGTSQSAVNSFIGSIFCCRCPRGVRYHPRPGQ